MPKKRARVEKDSIGILNIPGNIYYGVQTQRAVNNFPISGLKAQPVFLESYIYIKKAAAITNSSLGLLDKRKSNSIIKACNEILKGKLTEYFVIDIFQAGAGTSFNMNVNEVIANRAIELLGGKKGNYSTVSPNDDVNMSQSTNDTYPSAMRIACLKLTDKLLKVVKQLEHSLKSKEKEFKNIIKSGRTHLQDASPITMGQEFSGYAEIINKYYAVISFTRNDLLRLGIGGTAVGTGLNAHSKYQGLMIKNLSKICGYKFSKAENNFAAMQSMYPFTQLSSALKNLCTDLAKISNDIRLLASGPMTGFGEIILPAVQPGSSIMPGKINPSIAEMLDMVCYQVIGNDLTITLSSQAGQLELNVMMPVICYNLLFSLEILKNGLKIFNDKCVKGIKVNAKKCREYAEKSVSIAAALNPVIGYLEAAKIVKESIESGKSIIEVIKGKNILTPGQMEDVMNILKLTRPGIIAKQHLYKK
jgi:aspartate ammonia-lyase